MNIENIEEVKEGRLVNARGELFLREGVEEYYVADAGFGEIGEYDWGAAFSQDIHDEEVVQVQFKNSRRAFYVNSSMLSLHRGDVVAVAAMGGHDVGVVCLTGWLARRNYLKQQCQIEAENRVNEPLMELYRKATQQDVERWLEATSRELDTMLRARIIAQEMHLQMKISDVEFQGDGSKALFYYSAEQRVDFRELVRVFASEFKVRIEMRQIGPRQEAARIGGIGSCGREVCCGAWLRKFASVTTSTIKLQDLTPNPQKQAGQCGKLKCCLNFEIDVYEEAKRKMPRVKAPLQFEDGVLYHVKNDLFRDCMYFSTSPKSVEHLVMLTCAQVEQILELNHSGRKGESLLAYRGNEEQEVASTQLGYGNVIEEESLTRFDKAKKKSSKNKNRAKQQKQRDAAVNAETANKDSTPALVETSPSEPSHSEKLLVSKPKTVHQKNETGSVSIGSQALLQSGSSQQQAQKNRQQQNRNNGQQRYGQRQPQPHQQSHKQRNAAALSRAEQPRILQQTSSETPTATNNKAHNHTDNGNTKNKA